MRSRRCRCGGGPGDGVGSVPHQKEPSRETPCQLFQRRCHPCARARDRGPRGRRRPVPADRTQRERRSLTGADIQNDSLTGADIRDGSLGSNLFSAAARANLRGATGPEGPAGPKGDTGAQGPAGAGITADIVKGDDVANYQDLEPLATGQLTSAGDYVVFANLTVHNTGASDDYLECGLFIGNQAVGGGGVDTTAGNTAERQHRRRDLGDGADRPDAEVQGPRRDDLRPLARRPAHPQLRLAAHSETEAEPVGSPALLHAQVHAGGLSDGDPAGPAGHAPAGWRESWW